MFYDKFEMRLDDIQVMIIDKGVARAELSLSLPRVPKIKIQGKFHFVKDLNVNSTI